MPPLPDVQFILNKDARSDRTVDIVFFLKRYTESEAAPWLVVTDLGMGDTHPFIYPGNSAVAAEYADGNYTPRVVANPPDRFGIGEDNQIVVVERDATAQDPHTIEVANELDTTARALLYKGDAILTFGEVMSPEMTTVFRVAQQLFVGVATTGVSGMVLKRVGVRDATEITFDGWTTVNVTLAGNERDGFTFTIEGS